MIPAMVLAAGSGTRLRPLTDHRPKALVPVGDRPALAHCVARLRAAGVASLVVNAHHRAADVLAFGHALGVEVSDEDEVLGTAGGIANAAAKLGGGDVLVWNADIEADIHVAEVVEAHELAGAQATLVVRQRSPGEGAVGVGAGGRVVRVRDARAREDEQFGADFLGVSVLGGALRAVLPARGCLAGDVWIPALRAGKVLRAHWFEGAFFDIGTLPGYLAANRAWLAARGLSHWVGEGARIAEGVSLEGSIVGEGAECTGAGVLSRCVVWPGAKAVAPLADAAIAA